MKLKYHLFFLIIFIQDILCFKYEDYIKSLPAAFHTAKGDSKKDELGQEKNKEENVNNNNNNNNNSNYKVGMKDIVNKISNKIKEENKNNNSYDKYDCNDDDDDNNNSSNSLFHKMMCTFKKKLFKNEQVIEKDIKNIKKDVIDLKENVVKDSSNITKHTNILKDDITRSSNYFFNLFKKSFNEEKENVNKLNEDNLNKLKNLPDSHLFFSKLLLTLSQKDDKDKNKNTHINNYYNNNNNINDETDKNTNLLQNILSYIKNFKHKDENNNIKKENDFFHSFHIHNETDKQNNLKDQKSSWWFTNKHDEKKNPNNDLNLLYNNSNNSFNSILNQNQTDHENLPEQVRKKNSQEENNKLFDMLRKYLHKNEKKDMNDNNKNNINVDDNNLYDLHSVDDKKNKFSFLNYWNDKHDSGDKDISKEGHLNDHSEDSNKNKMDDQKDDENKKFNIFTYFRKDKNKYEEEVNKNKMEINSNMNMEDANKVGDNKNDNTSDNTNDNTSDYTNDNTSDNTNNNTNDNTNDNTSDDMTNNLNNNLNNNRMNKVDEDPKGFVLDLVKNYYDNNKNVDNINYSLLLTSDKETNENINYHPLVKFKSCLMNCFNEINNKEKNVENESYLSLDDYKILEKCILKCKNNNLNDTHNEDPMKNDDTMLLTEKNKINDTKNNLLNDNINNLINDNNEAIEKETSSTWSNFFYKKNNKNIKDNNNNNNNNDNNDTQDNISVLTSSETNLENSNAINDNLSTHLMYDIDNNNNKNNYHNNSNYHNYKMKNLLIDSKFKYNNKEKQNNNIQDEQQDKNKNVYNKPFHFFNYFNNSNINTDENNIYNDNLTNNDDKYNTLKNINNNNNIVLNKNDIDNDENNNYISTGFFLFLLLITFFVYLSAFTNIINQFYLSFKEKICLFIKGKYKGTFDNVYEESCESFLPKIQYKNSQNNNNDHNFCQSYENTYHSFQENSFDIA